MAKKMQITLVLLLSIIAITLLVIAFKPSSTGQIIQRPEEKTNDELLKEHLENFGYEVTYIYFSSDSEIARVEMISFGSKYLQMIEGFNSLIYYYDTPLNSTMYQVLLINENKSCYYRLLNLVYENYLDKGKPSDFWSKIFDEGYCFE